MEEVKSVFAELLEEAMFKEDFVVVDKLPNGLTRSGIASLQFSDHAYRRIKERLDIRTKKVQEETLKDYLINSVYVGFVVAEDGNESYLYAYNGIGIYLNPKKEKLVTVKDYEKKRLVSAISIMDDMKQAVIDIQKKKMKQLNRKHKKLTTQIMEDNLNYAVEIAELDRKIFKTKSEKVKEKYVNRREELISLSNVDKSEVLELESNMRILSKGIVGIHSL